jgi:hypothetical protein
LAESGLAIEALTGFADIAVHRHRARIRTVRLPSNGTPLAPSA